MSSFFDGISGKTDQELAESISNLGGSVEITQTILGVILKVNNVKNETLRSFNNTLTERIIKMNNSLKSGNEKQRNASLATIEIAKELKSQIEERLIQAEMLTMHDNEINILKEDIVNKESIDKEQSEIIINIENKLENKDKLDETQSAEISKLNKSAKENIKIDNTQTEEINALKDRVEKLEVLNIKLSKKNSSISLLYILSISALIISLIHIAFKFIN